MNEISRRRFLIAAACVAVFTLTGCDRGNTDHILGKDKNFVPDADLYIGSNPDEDATAVVNEQIQQRLRSLQPGESFIAAWQEESRAWHTIRFANTPAGLAMSIDNQAWYASIIGSVGGFIPLSGPYLALQFTDAQGNPFLYNGLPMRYSLFTGELNIVRGH